MRIRAGSHRGWLAQTCQPSINRWNTDIVYLIYSLRRAGGGCLLSAARVGKAAQLGFERRSVANAGVRTKGFQPARHACLRVHSTAVQCWLLQQPEHRVRKTRTFDVFCLTSSTVSLTRFHQTSRQASVTASRPSLPGSRSCAATLVANARQAQQSKICASFRLTMLGEGVCHNIRQQSSAKGVHGNSRRRCGPGGMCTL